MTDWQPIETAPKEQVSNAMELLLTAKQINYVKSQTFAGPNKIAVIRRLINIGIQIEATDEIEQLREEKEILKIALQNIKECIAHKGDAEKDRDEMADHAYIITAIVIGLGSVR